MSISQSPLNSYEQWLSSPKQPGSSSPQKNTRLRLACSRSVEIWEAQSPVTTDGIIGVHECFKFIKEKMSM